MDEKHPTLRQNAVGELLSTVEDEGQGNVNLDHPLLTELRKATVAVGEGQSNRLWSNNLSQIMFVCHEEMRSAPPSLELNTLRKVYTDAALLRAHLLFVLAQPMDAIAALDHAIIIAGPYGTGRLNLIIDFIQNIQQSTLNDRRLRPNTVIRLPKPSINFLESSVPCLSSPPSFVDFQLTYSRNPFILRDFAVGWPALSCRPWRRHAYLTSVAGPGRVVPVEVGSDYRTADWQQKIMPWEEFLSFLEFEDHPALEESPDIHYLAQHDLTRQFPKLMEDVEIPDYLFADLRSTNFPGYEGVQNEEKMVFNIWLGPKGTLSPAHVDPYFNFYVQVVGHKSVWLAPPSVSDSMHTFAGSALSGGISCPSLSNTSHIDVFANLREYPDFEENVVPSSMMATLEPGDALFFPPGWWHSMKSESTSCSLSMWF